MTSLYIFPFRINSKKSKYQFEASSPTDDDEIKRLLEQFLSDGVLPSVSELFLVAALLSRGEKSGKFKAAQRAMQLWDESFYARESRLDLYVRTAFSRNKAAEKERESQIPKSYPASLDEVLRLLMPHKKRSEDRMKIYRDYIRDSLRVSNYMEQGNWSGKPFESTPIPTDDEIGKIIAKKKAEGFSESWYATTREFFLRWFSDYEAKKLSSRAKKAATAKWKIKNA